MSIARALLCSPDLSPCTKIVASYLSTFRAWWGHAQTLADQLGYSLRSIQRALVELAESGWTVVEGGALRLVRGDEHASHTVRARDGHGTATARTRDGHVTATHQTGEQCALVPAELCGERSALATPVSPVATPVSRPPSFKGVSTGKQEARRRQSGLFDHQAMLLEDQRHACAGLDVGPLVVAGDAALTYASAVSSDGRERVRATMRRVAEDAAAGRIPRHFWTRLFCGGGYAARRQAIADVDAAERRLSAQRELGETGEPSACSLRELDPARLLAELAPSWLRSAPTEGRPEREGAGVGGADRPAAAAPAADDRSGLPAIAFA